MRRSLCEYYENTNTTLAFFGIYKKKSGRSRRNALKIKMNLQNSLCTLFLLLHWFICQMKK